MLLKFYAKDDLLVTVPGARPFKGEAPRYVGREFVRGENGNPGSFPASSTPFECDSESFIGAQLARRVRLETQQHNSQPLWPADKDTAAACGVEFVAVEVKDGVAVPKEAKKKNNTSAEGNS